MSGRSEAGKRVDDLCLLHLSVQFSQLITLKLTS